MNRRRMIATLACACAWGVQAQEAAPRPRHRISAGRLYEAMAARFPLHLRLGPLFELEVSAPRLNLLPARNRLGTTLVARASGMHLPELPPGELDVFFALRYEPSDRSLRAHRAQVQAVRWPGLPPEALGALRQWLPEIAREGLGEVLLHRFTPSELALTDVMGFEPDTVTVVDDGLLVEFVPRQR